MSVGAVAVLYRAPPRAEPPSPAAGTDDLALRAELATLQGTIATLSERVESLTTVDEVRRTLDLGERLDRVSQQVAELAGNGDIPRGLDRRLDELAQGLGTVATRVERLAATSERPEDSSLADVGDSGTGAEVSRPGTQMAMGGIIADGIEGTGPAEPGTDPVRAGVTDLSLAAGGQLSPEVSPVVEPPGEMSSPSAQSDFSEEVPAGAAPDGGFSGGASPDGVPVGSQSADADASEDNPDRSQVPRPQEVGAVAVTAADGSEQVEAQPPAAQATPPDPMVEDWVVNLIAVRRESTALDLQQTVREKGIVTEMLELPSGLFGLRVGGFGSRAEATAAATAIGADLGIEDAYVSRR
jgi:cell division septation protein DedD